MRRARTVGDSVLLTHKLRMRGCPTAVVRGAAGGFVLYGEPDIDEAVRSPQFIGVYDPTILGAEELQRYLEKDLSE